jgi:hypothetical protein
MSSHPLLAATGRRGGAAVRDLMSKIILAPVADLAGGSARRGWHRRLRLALAALALAALAVVACRARASAAAKEGAMAKAEDMTKAEPAMTLATAQEVRIEAPVVAVRLPVAGSGPAAERLRQALASARGRGAEGGQGGGGGRGTVELILDGISVAAPPGVMFDVYLGSGGPQPRRQYVGTLSFFGLSYRPSRHALPVRTLPTRSFDVTGELSKLAGAGHELPELVVTFEATSGTAESTPAKAGVQLNPKAGLRIGSIRLRIQG